MHDWALEMGATEGQSPMWRCRRCTCSAPAGSSDGDDRKPPDYADVYMTARGFILLAPPRTDMTRLRCDEAVAALVMTS